jgi:hypothetical protein
MFENWILAGVVWFAIFFVMGLFNLNKNNGDINSVMDMPIYVYLGIIGLVISIVLGGIIG